MQGRQFVCFWVYLLVSFDSRQTLNDQYANVHSSYIVLTYIDIGAVRDGVSPDYSFYLVAIANASSAVGRLVTGFVVDKTGAIFFRILFHYSLLIVLYMCTGAINFIAPTTFIAGIITFVWPFATSGSSLTAVAVLYG